MSDFDKYKIKQYKHWGVYIHTNQTYLGRLVIWCDRKDALDLTDVTKEEYIELLKIIKEFKKVLVKAFSPDWFNYSLLGNATRHLHAHFIPRYSREVEFTNITFKDERWGHNYRTNHDFKIPEETLMKIKDKIESCL